MLKYITTNLKFLVKRTGTIIGAIYAFLGFIGVFVPLTELFPQEMSIWLKVIIAFSVFLGLSMICFAIVFVVEYKKKSVEILQTNGGHGLFVQYGDLFSENEVKNPSCRRNIIIPVNRCFDTIVDNELVSESTIHGMAFKKLYSLGLFSEQTLRDEIDRKLLHTEYAPLPIGKKPRGNLKRYPVGTVVDIAVNDNTHYFLWALSTFDERLKARTSMQDYSLAVQRLIESCNNDSEGFPVLLPLVGTGLSRTKKEQCDVLNYLISAFTLNRNEINSDIHIVIHEKLKQEIPFSEI